MRSEIGTPSDEEWDAADEMGARLVDSLAYRVRTPRLSRMPRHGDGDESPEAQPTYREVKPHFPDPSGAPNTTNQNPVIGHIGPAFETL